MIAYSLTATICRYRGERDLHNALCMEADERGETLDLPVTYWGTIEKIEQWDQPAKSLLEAVDALTLAVEDYEQGDTDRIPAMMKAALGWMQAEAKRRKSA
jgi:hypothetical protein